MYADRPWLRHQPSTPHGPPGPAKQGPPPPPSPCMPTKAPADPTGQGDLQMTNFEIVRRDAQQPPAQPERTRHGNTPWRGCN